jgi:F-type H+-transporting ATPase subunit epsilon
MSLNVIIYTPTKITCNITTEEVVITTLKAEMSIRPYHCKIICSIPISLIRMKVENKWKLFITLGGVAKLSDDKLVLCLRGAEEIKSVDLVDIEVKLNQAEQELKQAENDQVKLKASETLQKLTSLLKASAYF